MRPTSTGLVTAVGEVVSSARPAGPREGIGALSTSRRLERLAWVFGIGLLVTYGAVRVHDRIRKQRGLDRFATAREAVGKSGPAAALDAPLAVDFTLWSEGRIRAYESSIERALDAPMAVLRVPSVGIEVPVLEGTDDVVLDRGAGHIEGTSLPGERGNIGIAGHRDGFFRGLKDVAAGDLIELETLGGTEIYVVDTLAVVERDAVDVLRQTDEPSVTLVTCYPFYYVGPAPQRFIVRAVRTAPPVEAGI